MTQYQERIDRVKDGVLVESLVEYLGGIVEQGYGNWLKTKCPFHADFNPSASTNNLTGRFVCHACGIKGDVIDLAKLHLEVETGGRVAFEDVLAWLEEHWLD